MRKVLLALGFLIGMANAQTDCSPKFWGGNCDFFEGKPDSAWLIFTVGLPYPGTGQDQTAENRAKLRRWTDTLFLKYDIRLGINGVRDQERAQPPPDSLLNWTYQWLSIQKATAISLAEEEFVAFLEYHEKFPTAIPPHGYPLKKTRIQSGSTDYFDLNGRIIFPTEAGSDKTPSVQGVRIGKDR